MGSNLLRIITPVISCCLYVAIILGFIGPDISKSNNILIRLWTKIGLITEDRSSTIDEDQEFSSTIVIISVVLGLLAIVTFFLIFAIYLKLNRCLHVYLHLPNFIVLCFVTPLVYKQILISLNMGTFDLITVIIIVWNITVLGMSSIFGLIFQGPLILEQSYLVHNASMLAVVITWGLPGLAPHIILVALIFWDLFAVLSPCGPLRLMINLADEAGITDMPGLIYSTNRNLQLSTSVKRHNSIVRNPDHDSISIKDIRKNQSTSSSSSEENYENFDLQIGLGDFVFYGLLVGITSRHLNDIGPYSTIAVTFSILIGVILTMIVSTVYHITVPALPISLSLGLMVLPISSRFVPSLTGQLAHYQLFI